MRTLCTALVLLLQAPAWAQSAPPLAPGATEGEKFKLINVKELEDLIKEGKVQIYDANTESFRAKEGMIAGAHALSHIRTFDTSTELPQDKGTPLVFYCVSTHCTCSHMAASRAIEAGFTQVSVLSEGLMGWKKAGMKSVPAASAHGLK